MSETRIDRGAFARAIHASLFEVGGQAALAKSAGVAPSTICRTLKGDRLPSAENYLAICHAIGADPMVFVEHGEPK